MRLFWRCHCRDSKLAPCYETCLFLNAWEAKGYTSNWVLLKTGSHTVFRRKTFYSTISTHIWMLGLTLVFRVTRKCLPFFPLIPEMCALSDQLKKLELSGHRIMWYQDSSYKWLSGFSGSSLGYATLVMVLFSFQLFSHIETQETRWRSLLKGTFSYFILQMKLRRRINTS